VKESVELGQHERLLSYGPTFRPITVGQPLKGSRKKRGLTGTKCSILKKIRTKSNKNNEY